MNTAHGRGSPEEGKWPTAERPGPLPIFQGYNDCTSGRTAPTGRAQLCQPWPLALAGRTAPGGRFNNRSVPPEVWESVQGWVTGPRTSAIALGQSGSRALTARSSPLRKAPVPCPEQGCLEASALSPARVRVGSRSAHQRQSTPWQHMPASGCRHRAGLLSSLTWGARTDGPTPCHGDGAGPAPA